MPVRILIPAIFLLGAMVRVAGGEYTRASLFERSPFAPVKVAGAGAVPTGEFELRGFFGRDDALEASIHKAGTNESRWIAVGATERGWTLESADIRNGTAVLVTGGIRLRLKLAESAGIAGSSASGVEGEPVKSLPSQPLAMSVAAAGDARIANAKEEALRKLRMEHPEYFKEANLMTDEERRISRNAFREIDRQTAMLAERPPE